MRKALFLASFALAGLVSFNAAAADELGEPGQIALGADRVFGFNFWSATITPDGSSEDIKASGTSLGLIANGGSGAGSQGVSVPYMIPRLALDYMAADGLSIGGSLGYMSNTSKQEVGGESQDGPTVSGFILAPRVGYVIPVSDGADFWVRGGITYFSATTAPDEGDDTTVNGLALTGEGMFVLSPIAGFGFAIGPTLDVGLSGGYEQGDNKADVTVMNIGVNGGLVGWF